MRRAVFAALFAAAVVLVIWLLARSGSDETEVVVPDSEGPAQEPSGAQPSPRPPAPDLRDEALRAEPGTPPTAERLKRELEAYRQISVYPHWSRPLTPDMKFKIEWNDATTSELPFAEGDDTPIVRFDADRAHVMFGEPYTSWIEAWRGDSRTPVPVEVEGARLMLIDSTDPGARSITLSYNDDGRNGDAKSGDGIPSNQFYPSHYDELGASRDARIVARVTIEGETRNLVRTFSFASRPILEVLGITDQVRDGHLVITLKVRAHEPGLHGFEANLFDEGGQPVAYATKSFELEAGMGAVDLVFFGRIFVDGQHSGTFVVRDIRGRWSDPAQSGPPHPWAHAGEHVTGAYQADEFSGSEWDSEEKRKKIGHFERLIDQMGK